MATLYRQYRPKSFQEVVGQEHVTETLKAAVKKDRLAHAYLFHGPRGTGKTTTARLLASRVNCVNAKEAEACGKCEPCLATMAGNNIDIIEIDAASNRGVDDIRALRERIVLSPSLGKYKVYIIDEAHMLTPEASAALLKTLEEPVKHAIFILATTELHKVLPTILSRCQVFRFRRASREELITRLNYLLGKEKRTADSDVLDYIVDRSGGCFRDAESLLGQLLTLQQDQLKMDTLVNSLGLPPAGLIKKFNESMFKGESAGAIEAVDETFNGGHDLEQFIKESMLQARDQAILCVTERKAGAEKWAAIIRALLQATQDLAYVPQPSIALYLAVLTVCTAKGEASSVKTPEVSGVAEVKKEAVAVKETATEAAAPTRVEASPPRVEDGADPVQLEAVKNVWPQLIEKVRGDNPVASTFLRAVEPLSVNSDVLSVRTRYSLHKNFFTTAKNKLLVTETLAELLGKKIGVTFILDENSQQTGPSLANMRKSREDEFYSMVKEVFN